MAVGVPETDVFAAADAVLGLCRDKAKIRTFVL